MRFFVEQLLANTKCKVCILLIKFLSFSGEMPLFTVGISVLLFKRRSRPPKVLVTAREDMGGIERFTEKTLEVPTLAPLEAARMFFNVGGVLSLSSFRHT